VESISAAIEIILSSGNILNSEVLYNIENI
jgi:hypothetical protein